MIATTANGVTTTAVTTTPSTVPPSATLPAPDTAAATVAPTLALTDTAITTTVAALNAAPAVTDTGLTQGYGRLPLSFVPNQGQVDPAVQFVSRAPGLALYLTAGDATLALVNRHAHEHRHPLSHGSALLATTGLSATVPISAAAVRLHVVGANTAAQAIGQNQLPGIANYLIGSDPAGWRTGLPTYAQVSYQDVYPGVDLVYYGNQAQLEYDWRVAPGADPHAIAFQGQGARGGCASTGTAPSWWPRTSARWCSARRRSTSRTPTGLTTPSRRATPSAQQARRAPRSASRWGRTIPASRW